jgi:crotonobetainyl-CoA:carnitine CoA-transferase CaiB-like acyl-CoA transferase
MPDQPLRGLTVLDLTENIAGPYCTKLLADFGADVIKVERPGTGDPTRRMAPFFHDEPHPERSGPFLHLNTNKRGITLDLEVAAGRRIFLELARTADVLVESFAPGVLPSLGLGHEALRSINPRLVKTSISNFGQDGPYRDYQSSEIVTYALGGPMYATGLPDRAPLKLGGNVVQYQAGAVAAAATAIALWDAEATGRGERLDVSLMRVQAASQDRRTTMLLGYQYTGEINERRTPGSAPGGGVRPCADGYVNINGSAARFPLTVRMIGQPELLSAPLFKDEVARSRPGVSEEFDAYYIPFLMEHSKRECFELSQAFHIPSGPIYDMADVLGDAHFQERDYWLRTDHAGVGQLTQPGRPFIMNRSPWAFRRPAPGLGQHNEAVLCGVLGYSPLDLARLRRLGVI